MSLYNMLMGQDANADIYYDLLDLDNYHVGRYRDCYLSDDKKYIILLTRNGGGNREDYQYCFDSLRSHPKFVYDQDCAMDETYCEYYFYMPTQEEIQIQKINRIVDRMENTLDHLEEKAHIIWLDNLFSK